ncbi:MAG: FxLYD domain-containing protein [Chloroflexota bacterium]|nr:FxLYD domain-containing protein [Chloroflexota bacterium]
MQKGDSLWTIAREYGVTVEALQEANAILDPRGLQIGQELVIPQMEEALVGTPTPTPTPLPLDIQGLNYYESPVGSLWFLGEVKNATGEGVEQVEVGVSLYDENGELLAAESAFTPLDVVPDGGKAPFAVLFTTFPVSFASYQAVILSAVSAVPLESRYHDLIVEGHGELQGPFYVVGGEVRNVGQCDAQAVKVVVTAYDAQGEVVGVRTVGLERDILAAGESLSFEVELLPAGGGAATCSIQVQGRRAE